MSDDDITPPKFPRAIFTYYVKCGFPDNLHTLPSRPALCRSHCVTKNCVTIYYTLHMSPVSPFEKTLCPLHGACGQ